MLNHETIQTLQGFANGVAQNLISSIIVEIKKRSDDKMALENAALLERHEHSKLLEVRLAQKVCEALRNLDLRKQEFDLILPLASDAVFGGELARQILADRFCPEEIATLLVRCSPSTERLGNEEKRLALVLVGAIQNAIAEDPHLCRVKALQFQTRITAQVTEVKAVAEKTEETVRQTGQFIIEALSPDIQIIRATLRSPTDKTTEPEESIPAEIKVLLVEASDLRHEGREASAKEKCEEALKLAKAAGHAVACVKARAGVACIVSADDFTAARALYRECLDELRLTPAEPVRAYVLSLSGENEVRAGNLDEAKALLSESLTLYRQLNDRDGIADCLHVLALLADRDGRLKNAEELLDEASELFMVELQSRDPMTEKKVMGRLSACCHNKALVQKHHGNLIGALANLEKAVDWSRKAGMQHGLAETLFSLAEAKCADAKWEAGVEALNEAKTLFLSVGDYFWVSECLDLFGRICNTRGHTEEAVDYFAAALSLLREKGTPRQTIPYLFKLAQLLPEIVTGAEITQIQAKLLRVAEEVKDNTKVLNALRTAAAEGREERQSQRKRLARSLLEEAKELSDEHHLLEQLADAELALADLGDDDKHELRQHEARRFAIETLKKLVAQTQLKRRSAFLMARIGSLHQQLTEWNDALDWFTRAKELFEEIGEVGGVANCYGSIAEIKREQHKPSEELDAYRHLLGIVQGKPFPDLIAGTKINMGKRLMESGNLREAKQLFEDARLVCSRHSLQEFLPALHRNLEAVRLRLRAQKPAGMDFAQLLGELHELAAWFPEAKKQFLPFWYYCRDAEIWGNIRSLLGVKFLVFDEGGVGSFLQFADRLSSFGDLFLHVSSSSFPESQYFIVPFPNDRIIPARVAIAEKVQQQDGTWGVNYVQGSVRSPYCWHPDEMRSSSTGNVGSTISGRDKLAPDCAYELMLGHSSADLVRRRVFFFPYERHRAEDKCLTDLELASDLGAIPVYTADLPKSDEVEVLRGGRVELAVPQIYSEASGEIQLQVGELKRKLVCLLSLKDDEAVAMLAEILGHLDGLRASSGASHSICMTAFLLRAPVHGAIQTRLALVRHPD